MTENAFSVLEFVSNLHANGKIQIHFYPFLTVVLLKLMTSSYTSQWASRVALIYGHTRHAIDLLIVYFVLILLARCIKKSNTFPTGHQNISSSWYGSREDLIMYCEHMLHFFYIMRLYTGWPAMKLLLWKRNNRHLMNILWDSVVHWIYIR